MTRTATFPLAIALAATTGAAWAEGDVNLYSSRHYDTDEQLYQEFTEQTGITVNRIEGKADELVARIQAEGQNSPADVFITVDTSRLERAKDAGILQSIDSEVLEAARYLSMGSPRTYSSVKKGAASVSERPKCRARAIPGWWSSRRARNSLRSRSSGYRAG